MKLIIYLSIILVMCLSILQCQEVEDEDTELVEPVTVETSDLDDEEDTTASDLDIIPSLADEPKPKAKPKPKPKTRDLDDSEDSSADSDDSPSSNDPPRKPSGRRGFGRIPEDVRTLASDVQAGTLGLFTGLRDRMTEHVADVGLRLQARQRRLQRKFQQRVGGFVESLGGIGGGLLGGGVGDKDQDQEESDSE